MGYRSYEWKIIYVLIIVFALIQAGVFLGLSYQNENIARQTLELELETGADVLDRLLRLRHRQLEQAARVLAADIDLRDAIVRRDIEAAEALLLNHEGRVRNTTMILSDQQDRILLALPGRDGETWPLDIALDSPHYAQAAREPLVALLNPHSDMVYQIITVPVSSAMPVAWLTIGFALVDSLVQTLENVANSQYSFLSHTPGGPWKEHVSTFSPADMQVLLPQFAVNSSESQTLRGRQEEFMVRPFALSRFENLELVAMVGKSLDQAMQPFNEMQRRLLYWVFGSGLLGAIAIYLVTRRMVGPLNTMAHVDTLTGLVNRRVFELAVNKLGSTGEASIKPRLAPFGVMLMDMDGFRQLNDELGHTVGDEVLRIIASRLQAALRQSDIVARYGGDEFAVLMPNVERPACTRVAEMILESLERKIPVDGMQLEVGINIGIAISPEDGQDRATLLRKADLAMHAARKSGRGFAFFSE